MSDRDPLPCDEVLDVQGLNCPLPILKTKVALNCLQDGQVLQVLATDPLAPVDFRSFCARSPHELLQLQEANGGYIFWIRKASRHTLAQN